MNFLKIKILNTAVNCVTLQIDLARQLGARIYRAQRAGGPYEEVGLAQKKIFVDTAALTPGKTYYYLAMPWSSAWMLYEPNDLKGHNPIAVKVPRAPKEKHVAITRKRSSFSINLGGYLDESNTVTEQPPTYCGTGYHNPPHDKVFEPNMYVAIENSGKKDVINPWLVANGQRDWWSVETMADEILRKAGGKKASENEKAMAIWKFGCDEIYDSRAGIGMKDSNADPVRLFNTFGFDGCTADAIVCRRISEAMGLKAREVWLGALAIVDGYGRGRCCDHDIHEVWADGAWHFLDNDLIVFMLNRDNLTAAGSQDLVRDADLLVRSLGKDGSAGRNLMCRDFYYEAFRKNMMVYPRNKSYPWHDDARNFFHSTKNYPASCTMALRLRPGEKLLRYWDNIGKNLVHGQGLHPNVRFSNGKLEYRPNLREPVSLKGAESSRGIVCQTSKKYPALHPEQTDKTAEVVWKVQSPYAIAGAKLGLSCQRQTRADAVEVLVSLDGKHFRPVWVTPANHSGKNNHIAVKMDACIDLDWLFNHPSLGETHPTVHSFGVGPSYAYYIKVAMWAGSKPEAVGLNSIRFDTDIQCSTHSLPSLFCGKNTIVYRDDTSGARNVKVTYGWQENRSIRPPETPEAVYPKDNADVDCLDFEFRWKRPKGNGSAIDDYYIQVSRYSDFRWPASLMFDRYVSRTKYKGKTSWQAELPNLLNPDEKYFWRVRAINSKGIWSKWSSPRQFTAHGPGLPMKLRISKNRILKWSPNEKGNPPIAYRVHGSMDPGGFSANKKNLLAVVDKPCYSLKAARKGMSYRVIAVDANNVPSTPSDFVKL